MKIAIHIFTIYMLALSLIPCGDGGGGIVELANHFFGLEHQHVSDHQQHSQGCGDDTCSPFCVCSCCSSAIDIPIKLPLEEKYFPPKAVNTPSFFSSIIPFSFHDTIWQPPKLS